MIRHLRAEPPAVALHPLCPRFGVSRRWESAAPATLLQRSPWRSPATAPAA